VPILLYAEADMSPVKDVSQGQVGQHNVLLSDGGAPSYLLQECMQGSHLADDC